MRLFKIIAGVILILSGIFCFANPGETFLSIAFLLGCAMLISGVSGVLAYIWISRKKEISNLTLIEGSLTLILGCLVLSNQLLADAAIPVFFGLWVMFSGVLRVVEAMVSKKAGQTARYWILALGSLNVILGIYSFYNSVLFSFSAVMLVGLLFVVQGGNVLMIGIHLPFHKRNK